MDRRDLASLKGKHEPPTVTLDSGDDVMLPMMLEVCPTCEGKGSYVNPSIDSNGLSMSDFAADPDFEADYFSGAFDVQCKSCLGDRVVPVVDESMCEPELLAMYHKEQEAIVDEYLEMVNERRMGY